MRRLVVISLEFSAGTFSGNGIYARSQARLSPLLISWFMPLDSVKHLMHRFGACASNNAKSWSSAASRQGILHPNKRKVLSS